HYMEPEQQQLGELSELSSHSSTVAQDPTSPSEIAEGICHLLPLPHKPEDSAEVSHTSEESMLEVAVSMLETHKYTVTCAKLIGGGVFNRIVKANLLVKQPGSEEPKTRTVIFRCPKELLYEPPLHNHHQLHRNFGVLDYVYKRGFESFKVPRVLEYDTRDGL